MNRELTATSSNEVKQPKTQKKLPKDREARNAELGLSVVDIKKALTMTNFRIASEHSLAEKMQKLNLLDVNLNYLTGPKKSLP